MQTVEVIADGAAALAALDPIRARLLAELRGPASATELANRIGLTRQKVNYHLRKLEEQGLVVTAETRRWGGLTERRVVASAAGYLVSPAALGGARLLSGQLYEIGPNDPPSLAIGIITLTATALVAGYLPARRAVRVDPTIALRSE